ncbi:hypothetical protein [Streptomyces poriferorum]|uniref:Uncharacterized protein n=1 Tax=Streptomyces poriferorum TaxID=2798799 RepID=A0ABY9J2L0_9ACTN|nr:MULTISPECIES: hypothetical protein [unclassified Streptomyces]MDP5310459.1 hypothetical protein [Streptomyces sp. Alt4]WLQ60387.1 hypothetical protein P8A19_35410 [Streptomyces sp. Alt2]
MTRRLTVAERLASADKDIRLADIAAQSSWDQFLVEQAAFHYGQIKPSFTANDLRAVLPEMGQGFLGAAINALRAGGVIEHTGAMVPSTSPATHGHRLVVWQLSARGRAVAAERTARAQGRAA